MSAKDLLTIVSEISKIPLHELNEEIELYNSTIISSLNLLQLMSAIEKKYSITIRPEELIETNFKDIRTLNSFVESKSKQK